MTPLEYRLRLALQILLSILFTGVVAVIIREATR